MSKNKGQKSFSSLKRFDAYKLRSIIVKRWIEGDVEGEGELVDFKIVVNPNRACIGTAGKLASKIVKSSVIKDNLEKTDEEIAVLLAEDPEREATVSSIIVAQCLEEPELVGKDLEEKAKDVRNYLDILELANISAQLYMREFELFT